MARRKKTSKRASKKKAKKKVATKPGRKAAKKMGRPEIKVKWKDVAAMCKIQCTAEEICALTGTSRATLLRACKRDNGCTFEAWSAQKGKGGKRSLRRRQFKAAMDGNVVMMIWLGKQWLSQADKTVHRVGGDPENPAPIKTSRGLSGELKQQIKKEIMGMR